MSAPGMAASAQQHARRLLTEPLNFHPAVFPDEEFPRCDFDNPQMARELLGPYTIACTYYDRDYQPVTTAAQLGRYGAVVTVTAQGRPPLTYFRTLFRRPQEVEITWQPRTEPISVKLPEWPWLNPGVARQQAGAISATFWGRFRGGVDHDPNVVALLAGLFESKPSRRRVTTQNDVLAQDRQWWVGLKRKLYGMDRAYPAAFICPKPTGGAPATVLREGTEEEAEVTPGSVTAIDALLHEWAADTNEAFAVCLARHGVIYLHRAYGRRDRRRLTITGKSWVASITKLLSGAVIMMLVDQGLVDLDDPVGKFLPAFGGIPVETPLTIRHLFTHTSGLWGHWGDGLHDFEQLIAGYYPYLQVGKGFEYNGAGLALAGKIVELISGEALPQFYQSHLLAPLGCQHLEVLTMSGGARSAPLDLARIAQMLLNRGAYGDLRFFSEETFQQMMPQRLTLVLGPDTDIHRGIGVYHFTDGDWLSYERAAPSGMAGRHVFGHGAASSSDLAIDPVHDSLIVMTRNDEGRNFAQYHPRFLELVARAMA